MAGSEKVISPVTSDTSSASPAAPSATGICCMMSSKPIAASIPLMTLPGTSEINRPARSRPNRHCSAPAIISAVRNAEKLPSDAIEATTIVTRPAAGPLTAS